jgi:rhodanese-related sulfurtransferase
MVTLKKNALLVDVRTEAEFAEAHVNGSTIPLDQLPNQLEKFKGKEQIIVLQKRKSQWSCQNDSGTKF